ncbi:hypothetical protein FKP32DRAFT_1580517 [Trametes sanguinea]|nr:hypothetical protein FKP32DRAFT_1580517 [Trametes sanguinea]
MAEMNLPTYVLSADECPPDDDRRHGCGICHRRFNRPSSLRIHMNSHTGEQPFECPFPGCSRRFSVNSNMRRHYRNHRDAANAAAHAPSYPHPYYREQPPYMLHRMNSSPASSSTMSSFSDGDDYPDSPVISPRRTRSASSTAYPPTQGRLASRPRACTISGCNCGEEAPGALRPAFQPGSSTPRYPPRSR